MKYKCNSVPFTKMIATNTGFLEPLCNNCKTLDCENDIETRKVSILGITVETKLLSKKDDSHIVVSCEGYISDDAKSDNK
jgi:hypothetical protein